MIGLCYEILSMGMSRKNRTNFFKIEKRPNIKAEMSKIYQEEGREL